MTLEIADTQAPGSECVFPLIVGPPTCMQHATIVAQI